MFFIVVLNVQRFCYGHLVMQKFYFFCFAEVIKEKGLEHVTVEDLVVEITPKGRGILT